VISPLGPSDSETRRHADSVYNKIIQPALQPFGFAPKRIDQLSPNGDINEAILHQIATAPMCVVVLTGLNANVMYELGVRQAWNLPVVLLAEDGMKLPFDLVTKNTIFYSLATDATCSEATKRLAEQVVKPERQDDIFSRTMTLFGDAYSLDCAFAAKTRALTVLAENLRRMKQEIEKDFEIGGSNTKAFSEFEQMFIREFEQLRQTVNVLESVASASTNGSPRSECEEALEKMKGLQEKADVLRKTLTSGRNDAPTLRAVKRKFDELIAASETIANGHARSRERRPL